MSSVSNVYRNLQKHLNKMPVGYPPTKSGVEISLLMKIFDQEQALAAIHLHYKYKPIDEIFETAKGNIESKEKLKNILDVAVSKGGISRRYRNGEAQYALLPFILWGMYEHQLKRLDKEFLEDTGKYLNGEFGLEMATSTLPKMRVIPVEKSVKIDYKISTYDELKKLISKAGDNIAIQECICKKIKDKKNTPCQLTDRREVCMSFGDLAGLYSEEKWARKITKEEALEIAYKNEEEGLALMPSNEQEPSFMCACCSDCCGMFAMMKSFPKPAEVVGSNFYAEINTELCTGGEKCTERCPIDAVKKTNSVSEINLKRCIGCGLCVPTCSEKAIQLIAKEKEVVPPATLEDHFDIIYANRMSIPGKMRSFAIKSILRILTNVSKRSKTINELEHQ